MPLALGSNRGRKVRDWEYSQFPICLQIVRVVAFRRVQSSGRPSRMSALSEPPSDRILRTWHAISFAGVEPQTVNEQTRW